MNSGMGNFLSFGGGGMTSLLGQSGMGLTGSTNESEQTTKLDPVTQALNNFRLNQMMGASNQVQGLGGVFSGIDAYKNLDPQTQALLQQGTQFAQQPGLDLSGWYNQSNQDLNYTPQLQALGDMYGGFGQGLQGLTGNYQNQLGQANQQNLGQINNLALQSQANIGGLGGQNQNNIAQWGDQIGSRLQAYGDNNANMFNSLGGNYYNALGQLGQNNANMLNNLGGGYYNNIGQLGQNNADMINNVGGIYYNALGQLGQGNQDYLNTLAPNLLGSGQDYFRQILSPQLSSQNALMGLGRSGADLEAQAKGAASIALPLAQQMAQLQAANRQNTMGLQAGQLQQVLGLRGANASQAMGLQAGELQQLLGLQGANASQTMGVQANQLQQLFGAQSANAAQLLGLQGQNLSQDYSALINNQQNVLGLQSGLMGQNLGLQSSLLGQNQGFQAGLMGQNLGLQGSLYGQRGQAESVLGQQYLQNLYGLNQSVPGNALNLQNAQLQRLNQGVQLSDYARQVGQGTYNTIGNMYLSALNQTPYTPGGSIQKTGTNDEGILDSAFGGAAGAGAGAAGAKMLSDKREKTNVAAFDSQAFLDSVTAYTYTYKNSETIQAGIMAQDLENTELGEQFVVEQDGKKYIDYPRMASLLMACIVDLNARLVEVEHARQ